MRTMVKFDVSSAPFGERKTIYIASDEVRIIASNEGATVLICSPDLDHIFYINETPEEALAKLGFNNGGGA